DRLLALGLEPQRLGDGGEGELKLLLHSDVVLGRGEQLLDRTRFAVARNPGRDLRQELGLGKRAVPILDRPGRAAVNELSRDRIARPHLLDVAQRLARELDQLTVERAHLYVELAA